MAHRGPVQYDFIKLFISSVCVGAKDSSTHPSGAVKAQKIFTASLTLNCPASVVLLSARACFKKGVFERTRMTLGYFYSYP